MDATTNPSLLLKAAALPHYGELLDQAKAWAGQQGGSDANNWPTAVTAFAVDVGKEILAIIPGRISTEVDARLSFDTDATMAARTQADRHVRRGRHRPRAYPDQDSFHLGRHSRSRATGKAEHQLQPDPVVWFQPGGCLRRCGRFPDIPFRGRILDWYKANTELVITKPQDDPGVQSVSRIYNYYKQHGYDTVVMGASFRNAGEIEALAGCDRLTISPALLEELAYDSGELATDS